MKNSLKTSEKNKIEKILKENLENIVHIDKEFRETLHEDILNEFQNKLTSFSDMEVSKQNPANAKPVKKSFKLRPAFLWSALAVVAFVLVGIGVVILNNEGYFSSQNSSQIAQTDDLAGKYALLYVDDGEVSVLRDGQKLSFQGDTELFEGDLVESGEDTIAEIRTHFGRIMLDANTGVALSLYNGETYSEVVYGTVFISTSSGFSGETSVETLNATTTIASGSALINQNSDKTEETVSWIDSLIGKVFATTEETEKDDSTKVVSIAGTVKVIVGNEQIDIDNGKEIVIKDKTAGESSETSRDQFESDFFQTVISKESSEGKNLGTIGDLVAPTVTIISPAEGSTVTEASLTITFTSSEDGWLINESPWRDIVAGQENTYTTTLKPGANAIKLRVKDYSYNLTELTLNIVYQAPYAIGWTSSQADSSGIFLAWGSTGAVAGSHNYVLYRNGSYYQSFPVRAETVAGANWTDTSTTNGQTYTYIVKLKAGEEILAMSEQISIVAQTYSAPNPEPPADPATCSVSLWRITGAQSTPTNKPFSLIFKSYAVVTPNNVAWSSSNCDTSHGYKLVWNEAGSPTYPGSSYVYYSNPSQTTGTVPSGTWYVRLCIYNGNGTCGTYSNQLYETF